MIKLYGIGGSRWVKPFWLLRELEVPFEAITVSPRTGDTEKPEYRAMNPYGKFPTLVDESLTLFESNAICVYLADKFSEKELMPKPGSTERALCNQWISFAVTELEQPLWRMAKHHFIYPENVRSEAEIELAKTDFFQVAEIFQRQLNEKKYLIGNRFTIADLTVAFTLRWASLRDNLLGPFPTLMEYMQVNTARPAFPKELYEY